MVNRLSLETYLLGVVSAEMGRRTLAEFEALKAQTVVSRTYAIRNLGRRASLGFDLHASTADQVYVGAGSETTEGLEAVQATRGMALTYNGAPINAFYYSTCGGQTAEPVEAFGASAQPYLRSAPDVDENGEAYCRISPRYRWREEWSGASLQTTLRRTLPAVRKVPSERVGSVRDIWVVQRTPVGPSRPPGDHAGSEPGHGGWAVGAAGTRACPTAICSGVPPSPSPRPATGGAISHLVAEGRGAGHGVGLCQWGAVGRSRAGQNFQRILAAYYPGTTLERLY